jgi:hypothetical protein
MPNPKYRVVSVKPVKTNTLFENAANELVEYALQKRLLEPGWEYGDETENPPIMIPFKVQIVVNGSRAVMDCLFRLFVGNEPEGEMDCKINFEFPERYEAYFTVWEEKCREQMYDLVFDAATEILDVPVPLSAML